MRLYGYWRSSASFRVRIALALKGLPFDYRAVHLVRQGGEHALPEFRALNPEALVPVLVDDARDPQAVLTQSVAIVEYLDEVHPEPPLLPRKAVERARVRALALLIACEIHPLNNLRVLRYLKNDLSLDDATRDAWYRHWVEAGLAAFEAQLAASPMTGRFCHGDAPTLADVLLAPQIYNARRYDCDLNGLSTTLRVFDACMALDAFQRAAPERQPDAE